MKFWVRSTIAYMPNWKSWLHCHMLRALAISLLAVAAFAQSALDPLPGRVASLSDQIRRRAPSAELLAERSAAMQELIRRDPARALELALPDDILADLRRDFPGHAADLEVRGEWSGTITEAVEDDFEHQESRLRWWLQSDNVGLDLRPVDPLDLRSGESVRVRGLRLGSVLAATQVTREAGATAETSCSPFGEQKIAVLLVTYPGVKPPAYDVKAIRQMFFGDTGLSLSGYWKEVSDGKTWATGEVFGPLMVDRTYVCQETAALQAATLQAAAASGLDLAAYHRVFIVFPGGCSLFSGMGTIGCSPVSYTFLPFDYATWAIAAHEGGHNLGLQNAMGRSYAGTPLGAPYDLGTRTTYLDPFSMMGVAQRVHYSAREKFQLGWLSPAEVQTVDQPGEYRILPLAQSTPGVKALRVRRPGTDGWFWIESREPGRTYETDLGVPLTPGAVVHYEDSVNRDSGGTGPADLLDFTPQSRPTPTADVSDSPLSPGRSWTDNWTGLQIAATREELGSGLTVTITRPAAPGCATFSETSRRHASVEEMGTIQVIAPPDCPWNVSSPEDWVDWISPSSGQGNATIAYRVQANTSEKVRRAALALGNIFTISQDGIGAFAVELHPSSGSGRAQTFTYAFHDADAFRDVAWFAVVFSQGIRYCSFYYVAWKSELELGAENSSFASAQLGDQGLLENHNCSLDLASSSIEFNGNDLQIRAAMRFQPAFAGDTEVELWTFGQSLTYVKYRMGFWTVGPLPALTAQGVVNAASFSSGAIAPGEIVALLGSGLGPAAGLSAANTEALPTSLGETTVTFDGQPAPLFFAGDDRIYAQVPYEVAGKPSTSVVATYRDWAGAPVSIPVAAAAPGVFLILSPMTGAVVDASHPSGRGGKVSIYATGQGLVDPLPDTGKPAALSPLSWARNVQVKIGGRDVPIDFAGLTPGYVGLLQIDLHVPTDAPTGADVPLELSVDGAPAQAAPLTIAIQ